MKWVIILSLLIAAPVMAQTTSGSISGSTAASTSHQANAQNTSIAFNGAATPADTASKEHVSGISPDVIAGAYAGSASQDGCMSTAQAGLAIAGAGAVAGHPVEDKHCNLRRDADYRGRMTDVYSRLGAVHGGLEGIAINAELYQLHEMNVDICMAEERHDLAGCQQEADLHTPTVADLKR